MRNSALLFLTLLIANACVDRLFFDPENVDQGILIVDGYISDEPGPYQVRLFRSSNADDILNFARTVTAKQVIIFDNTGNEEILKSLGGGVYETDVNGMQGQIGNKYHLQIELPDGTIFKSESEEILPTGTIDNVYYEFESFLPLQGSTQYGFRVYMDATSPPAGGRSRWRYTGVFSLRTYPELNRLYDNCSKNPGPPDPLPCSGFIWTGTFLKRVGECTCCISYISEREKKPHLNDNAILTNGTFKKVEMGYVDFNKYAFERNKYMLKVEQMSLSNEAYAYWRTFRDQKEGATSLFQPSFGRASTNIYSTNSNVKAAGFFYATAIQKKVAFINGNEASIPVPPLEINCGLLSTGEYLFLNSTVVPPPEWN